MFCTRVGNLTCIICQNLYISWFSHKVLQLVPILYYGSLTYKTVQKIDFIEMEYNFCNFSFVSNFTLPGGVNLPALLRGADVGFNMTNGGVEG